MSSNSKPFTIQPHFNANKLLAVNKSNAQHNEIKTRMTVAQRSKALHLNQMNLDTVLPEVSFFRFLISHQFRYSK